MGWLLTLFLTMPQVDGPVRVEMWFSRESYCTFARAKFSEQPMVRIAADGRRLPVRLKEATCRELSAGEADRVPPSLRHLVERPGNGDGVALP